MILPAGLARRTEFSVRFERAGKGWLDRILKNQRCSHEFLRPGLMLIQAESVPKSLPLTKRVSSNPIFRGEASNHYADGCSSRSNESQFSKRRVKAFQCHA